MLGLDEVWHDNLNLWNDDNTNSLKLYPDYPLWNKVDVKVGGIDVYKYVEIE